MGYFKKFLTNLSRFVFVAISFIYARITWFRISCYRWGILKGRRLKVPVICVGDIILGGSGKTPTVALLSSYLQRCGYRVAILCRGYGARHSRRVTVVSDGTDILSSAAEGGDEAVLLANDVPGAMVLSGKDSYELGRCAIDDLGATVCVMDGGYQHLGLARDMNIALVTPAVFGSAETAAEVLRESPSAIARADICIITKMDRAADPSSVAKRIAKISPRTLILKGNLEPVGLYDADCNDVPIEKLRGMKVFALSGIADHVGFHTMLHNAGASICGEARRSDHHRYSDEEWRQILIHASNSGARSIVTTEKDFAKAQAFDRVKTVQFYVLRVRMMISEGEDALFRGLMSVIDRDRPL